MVAHSHIDAAWLWTTDETIKVCKESFEKVLDLLDKHEGVVYVQSSALYYKWMEENFPETFNRIKDAVSKGKWHLTLPFVEFDAYMPSGEALIRQIVYARRYFREKFGVDPKTVFLPDTFGFTNTLPTLARLSGAKYFLTHKLNWNDVIEFPYRLFKWKGPDGSELLAHILIGRYSGFPSEDRIEEEVEEMKRFQGIEITYMFYGYGDHGGGIDELMAKAADEIYRRRKAVPAGPDEFFQEIEKEFSEKLPVFEGELYLQYHRGVFTTQSRFKRNYNKAEFLLMEAEKLTTLSWLLGGEWFDLSKQWEKQLLLDFHDIIAGSSIKEVYDEAERYLAEIRDKIVGVISKSISYLLQLTDIKRGETAIINTLPWRREIVLIDDEAVVFSGELASFGVAKTGIRDKEKYKVEVEEELNSIHVKNRFFEAVFSKETGALKSLKVKDKEYIDGGRGGVHIQVLVDEPRLGRKTIKENIDATVFDAWEVFYTHYPEGVKLTKLLDPEKVNVKRIGDEAVVVETSYRYTQDGRPDSSFKISYLIDGASPWIEINIDVNWNAAHRIAKLYIPFNEPSNELYFEQPYGWVKRLPPDSEYASLFDKAKWEAPLQRWAYIPFGDTGLVVFNEGIYGCDYGSRYLRLSLLRAAMHPNPYSGGESAGLTDQGKHSFRVAIMPIEKFEGFGKIQKASLEFLFRPLVWRAEKDGTELYRLGTSLLEVEGDAAMYVMTRYDEDNILVRIYNPNTKPEKARISIPVEVMEAFKVSHDGEEIIESLRVESNQVEVELKPREVASLKIRVKK
ncbi:MAG: hypothetical protein DRJ35_04230 [Thermoprotei archaeon]|nr:MAG: hypothetical protein DRJ35_04230 [Thermoprotei archaeon]